MTREEAWVLKSGFDRLKVTIEGTEILSETDGSYALRVLPMDAPEEVFKDTEKCQWALVHAMRPEML
jgi:hypothetical protein